MTLAAHPRRTVGRTARAAFVALAALLASPVAAPAGAAAIELSVAPQDDRRAALVSDRAVGFLRASVELPDGGYVHARDPGALQWSAGGRCGALVVVGAGTARAVPPGVVHGAPDAASTVGLTGADGLARSLPATTHVHRTRDGDVAFAVTRLPDDVEPAYPQRVVVIAAQTLDMLRRCDRPPLRLVRRAVAGAALRVTGTYAAPPPFDPAPLLDVRTRPHLIIGGPRRRAILGWGPGLVSLGDVTGDDRPDLAVGASPRGLHVVGVRAPIGTVDLREVRHPTLPGPGSVSSVAPAGDVDGDGTGDLVVGQPRRGGDHGVVRVLRGGPRLERRRPWMTLLGAERCAQLGEALAVVGDFDGDRRRDVAATTEGGPCGASRSISLHVLPLRPGTRRVATRGPDADGILLTGLGGDVVFPDVAAAGDVNGDGLDDLVAGASRLGTSRATVVFGAQSRAPVDLGRPGRRGIVVRGAACEELGDEVAAAGDVNGDGLDDVILAATLSCQEGPYAEGGAYVIFGGPPAALRTPALGDRGLRISGLAGMGGGAAVAGVGDRNGDGLDDVAITDRRTVRVVHGRREAGTIDLRTLGAGGLRLRVPGAAARNVDELATVPDRDGDDVPELAVIAPRVAFAGRTGAGAVLVLGSRAG